MSLRPIGNRVLIRRDGVQEVSDGGIVIPDEFHRYEHPPQWGTVLAIGSGRIMSDGTRGNPDGIEVGDRVLVAKFTGFDLTVQGDKVLSSTFEDILAIDE